MTKLFSLLTIMMVITVSCSKPSDSGDSIKGGIVIQAPVSGASGLMCANSMSPKMNYLAAVEYCKNFRDGGYSDWYLPSWDEMAKTYEATKNKFSWQNQTFWSSTLNESPYMMTSFYVNGIYKDPFVLEKANSLKSESLPVLPVRKFK